jgi:hypothetical protein
VNRSSLSQTREYTRASLCIWHWQPLHGCHTPCYVTAQSALRSECVRVWTACLENGKWKMWHRNHNITLSLASHARPPATYAHALPSTRGTMLWHEWESSAPRRARPQGCPCCLSRSPFSEMRRSSGSGSGSTQNHHSEFELHDEHIFCRGVQLQPCMPCSSVHCALRSSGHAGPRGSKWSLRWMGRWL